MEKHVYFVRHGQTDSNVDRIFRGRHAMLTELGRDQARGAGARIKAIGVDAIVTSDFPRALETARLIGEQVGITPQENALFVEWAEPESFNGKHEEHPEVVATTEAIMTAAAHEKHTDEESFLDFVARARDALAALEEHSAERICVVSHGGFLKAIAGTILFGESFTKEQFYQLFDRLHITNTGVSYARKAGPEHPWRIVTWNDISHFG